MRAVNLVPARRRAARQRQRRIGIWSRALGAYTLSLVAAVLIAQAVWGQADRALAEDLAALDEQASQVKQKLTALQPQLSQATGRLEASRAIAVQPDWSLLLALLGEVRGEKLSLNRISLMPEGQRRRDEAVSTERVEAYQLELAGVGEDQQAVSQFVLRLEQAEVFAEVKLGETSRTTVKDQPAVAFRVLCRLVETDEGGAS